MVICPMADWLGLRIYPDIVIGRMTLWEAVARRVAAIYFLGGGRHAARHSGVLYVHRGFGKATELSTIKSSGMW